MTNITPAEKKPFIPDERIASKIILVRGQKVILDRDLADLYGVETRVLKQAVRRNRDRFPEDFMFEFSDEELKNWRSQFVTSGSADKMGLRYMPFAFTEHGVLMLSNVLKSKQAIQVSIQIVRTFTKMREMLSNYRDLKKKIEEIEQRYDSRFKTIFEVLNRLLVEEDKPKTRIGFRVD